MSKKQPGRLICFVVLLVAGSALADSGIYKWTDRYGRTHFTDSPPPASSAEEVTLNRINSYDAPSRITIEKVLNLGRQEIVLYSATWCGVCKRARAFLDRLGVPYREYDVENSRKGRRDFERLNARGVPVILVGDQRVNGFSKSRLTNMLRNAGYEV